MSPEGIKRAIAAYKRGYEENRRTEQAKADHMALVEATQGSGGTVRFRASSVDVCGLPDTGHFREDTVGSISHFLC